MLHEKSKQVETDMKFPRKVRYRSNMLIMRGRILEIRKHAIQRVGNFWIQLRETNTWNRLQKCNEIIFASRIFYFYILKYVKDLYVLFWYIYLYIVIIKIFIML